MSEPHTRARTFAPIGLQLVALLVASLLAAQAISVAMITLLPPPRPQAYRVSEIAAALRGEPVRPRMGRPLVRSVERALPADLARAPRRAGPLDRALAAELGAPLDAVRSLVPERPPPWRRGPHASGSGSSAGWRARVEGRSPLAGPSRGWSPGDMPVFGELAAARRQGGAWVVVRSQPEPFPTEWERRGLIWLAAGFLLVAPAGYLFARRITAPLKRFAEAADRLGRDPRGPPLALSGPSEIGLAARAFNDMQARLRRYIDDRTAMVGAISHDLRTPLTRIRFKLERAPEDLRASVLSDVAQMEQMIADVLAFIRDEGQPARRERLDLLSLLECVTDDASLVGGDVEIAEAEAITVEGDPVSLQRLFANLVDNAVKYGAGARIAVRRHAGRAVVDVRDFGPGLSAQELERVFEPFYRSDGSRNLDRGGVGLGLPIARATARAHGGDVELVAAPPGLCARVILPLAA